MNTKFTLTALIAVALAGCGGGSSDSTSNTVSPNTETGINLTRIAQNATLTSIQCNELKVANLNFRPSDNVNQCWMLEVPEDYAKPDGKTIKVAVAKVPSLREKKGSFAFLMGGPGGSIIAQSKSIGLLALNKNHDVYAIDQRGTGFSQPSLFCDFYEMGTPRQFTECRNKHVNDGVDLNQYTNKYNAFDFLVLEKKLTQAKELEGHWKLYGGSYGTRLGMTMAREEQRQIKAGYQTQGAIDMMVLDGVLPVEVNGIKETPWANYESLDRLLEVCSRSKPYCDELEFKTKLDEMFTKLDSQYHTTFINYLIQKSMARSSSKSSRDKYTPVDLVKQDPAVLAGKIVRMVKENYDPTEPDAFVAMGLSNVCAEEVNKPAVNGTHPSRAKWGENVQKAIDASHHMEFSIKACDIWQVAKVPSENYQAPEKITYPVLLLNGANDGQTPPAWAKLSAKAFSNHLSLTSDAGDHVVLFSAWEDDPDCLNRLITEAINSPGTMKTLDTTCLNKTDFQYKAETLSN